MIVNNSNKQNIVANQAQIKFRGVYLVFIAGALLAIGVILFFKGNLVFTNVCAVSEDKTPKTISQTKIRDIHQLLAMSTGELERVDIGLTQLSHI